MSKNASLFGANLRYLRQKKDGKLSQTDLGDQLSTETDQVSRSAISSYEDGRAEPNYTRLEKICSFFNVTIDQILKEDLTKLDPKEIEKKENSKEHISGDNLRILTITTNDNGDENIEMVPERARAGYATGYSDLNFISKLDKYSLPFLPKGKTYRAFEISGDSMPPLEEGTIIIGEYIDDWNNVKDGQVCIVTTRSEGFVLKKVYNNVDKNNTYILKSTNLRYSPYEVEVHDISEMWKLVAHISKDFPDSDQNNGLNDMQEAIWRLDQEVLSLKRKK
ncbi:LexA family transcriptional regulator [Flammeovirga yaeyamensis]|uniref:LexA family transcriptional regulator n=1 Tax=Flammeovirga yaeyamensis TaxID=367791 RepID=A0AAX1N8L5_9BACT|nr:MULTISPECIES: LexA family transcriptional regulator [Flammeovirga]ANQ48612.1 LexA family transcriptional regulator [Flammeovirga sp. MY04]MBB3698696.1 transcriptional regulator with XRE-family HTH domain [Flammeovirga yaeyamensis]NMF37283.1 LexA family transcriptional regulator [Flammeovirga yaeyamensis]QWG03899.1 LexA family transcriptional regulator [Flammeovirga yaeyamensis]